MQEIVGTYNEFKQMLDTELQKNVESFVKIGYLLKVARDTNILYESGYSSVTEFAKAEYGLTKDIVSRYIAINDRYSENGYSEELKEEYKAFGVAKLAEMLTLSDEVIQSLSPDLTRRELQEVKKEIKEEEKRTDIEVALEEREPIQFETMAQNMIYQYFKENKRDFIGIFDALRCKEQAAEEVMNILAQSGVRVITARVPGSGKIMMSIKGEDNPTDVVNVRTNEKESYTWTELVEKIDEVIGFAGAYEAETAWRTLYGAEVAPVQPETVANSEENAQESKDKIQETKEKVHETEIQPQANEEKQEIEHNVREESKLERVTGEVVETTDDETLWDTLAKAFYKRYETRIEYSNSMYEEIKAILDVVHRNQWIFECDGKEYIAVEVADTIQIKKSDKILGVLDSDKFYRLFKTVYWNRPQDTVDTQMEIGDYKEVLPEGTKSRHELWTEQKTELEKTLEILKNALNNDNYALFKKKAEDLWNRVEPI